MSKKASSERSEGRNSKSSLGEPDEYFETSFGLVARRGRVITFDNLLTDDDNAALIDRLIEQVPELRREQVAARARLLDVLSEADTVDLLARASITYLTFDPDAYRESEHDRSPAHIEYLALQALGMDMPTQQAVDPMRQTELTGEAIELTRGLFATEAQLIRLEGLERRRDRPDDPTIEYRIDSRLQSLGIRGTGYVEHLQRVVHGCLDPFDKECRELLGFTGSDALDLVKTMAKVISDRIAPLGEEALKHGKDMHRQLKHERRHRGAHDRQLPDSLLDLTPTEARQRITALVMAWMFGDSRSLAVIDAETLASESDASLAACQSFLDAFSCPPEQYVERHHAFPSGAHPLTARPGIKVEGGYLFPALIGMTDAVRPRMEELLNDTQVWDRYAEARGRYLENEATRILGSALPGSHGWTALTWRSAVDDGDLDGLVTTDDLALRLQCKAGKLSASARRGAPDRMKRDVGELIEAAADQHRRLDAAVTSDGASNLGFTTEQVAALERLLQFEVIVCLDDVTVWATEAHSLKDFGALPADRHVPWIVSLTDLMAATDLLSGSQLIHYLLRRQRLERDGRIEAHDELDWVGNYIHEGLFFDDFFDGDHAPGVVRLNTYTEPIDSWYFARAGEGTVAAPKPQQAIGEPLRALLARLERERPPHWTLAAVSLLDGDRESREQWDAMILHIRDQVRRVGWSNASQLFNERLGLSICIDRRVSGPTAEDQVIEYCVSKAEEIDMPNWIAVGEGSADGLFVVAIERSPETRLLDTFLNPSLTGSQTNIASDN